MRNYSPVGSGLPGARRRRLFGRAALTAVAATAAGAVGLGATVLPASAAPPAWGYEQITPADSSATPIVGIGVSPDMSTVIAATRLVPMASMPSDGRAIKYSYGIPRAGVPWTLGPVDPRHGSQLGTSVDGVAFDGSRMLYDGGYGEGVLLVDARGGAESVGQGLPAHIISASKNLDAVAFRESGTQPGVEYSVSLKTEGHAPVPVSVDNDGAIMSPSGLGNAVADLQATLADNALAADGSSVIFTTTAGIPGDDDGGRKDVYRRILTPGAEKTVLISDANGSGDPDATTDADYRWATADHQRVFFVTSESLEPGDTDGEQDLYLRVGTGAPIRVSQGETVDGSPTGNGSSNPNPDWVMSSEDGNRTFFVTSERLTQDAPASGIKLYERDVAEGRTRFLAELALDDVGKTAPGSLLLNGRDALSFRGLRETPNGAAFVSRAPLAGAAADGLSKVFAWTRDGGLVYVSKPVADAPSSPAQDATIVAPNMSDNQMFEFNPILGGRGVSDDGSRVFFTTGQSLTAEDTDGGYLDVYAWTADGGVRLVTPPGRAPYDAGYMDSSPDGSEVYFSTSETILPGDTDPNVTDVYLAILGGGSVPGKPGPDADPQGCIGAACQGPISGPLASPGIGSVGFAGSGNLSTVEESMVPSLAVSKVKTVRGSVARLRVKLSVPGKVRVSGSGLARASKSVKKAGTYRVSVKLSQRARRTLKRKHRVRVRATVRLTPQEGRSVVKRVSITFKRSQAKHGKKAPARAATKKGGRR